MKRKENEMNIATGRPQARALRFAFAAAAAALALAAPGTAFAETFANKYSNTVTADIRGAYSSL